MYSNRKNHIQIALALLVGSAVLLLAPACGGESASSCSVEQLDDGQALVTCTDGTTATVTGPGASAESCTYEEENGSIHIHCDDGTDIVIQDGVDGNSGSSCSVVQNDDGSATIECDDGTSADVGTPDEPTDEPDPDPSDALGMELLAGVTSVGTSDGLGTQTRMDGALDGVYDPSGEFLYFVDTFNMTIRRFGLRTQRVVTLAGNAGQKGASDGIGTSATFEGPRGIAMHPDGERVFIADGFNCTIRQLDLTDYSVTTLAGQPGECAAEDGSFEDARFRLTIGMVAESTGRYIYAADRGNNVIRRLDLQENQVETIAGLLPDDSPNDVRGHEDAIGDEARFAGPGGIDLSEDETILYVNDTFNNVIRSIVVVSDGEPASPTLFEVETIAGAPGQAGNVDDIGPDARFQISQGLARADDGLFVAGFHNSIRRIDLDTFEVTTVAGQNGVSGSIDGISFDARFGVSFGILAHPDGRRIYYMDRSNNSIRLFDRMTREVTTAMGASEPRGWKDGPTGESRFNAPRGVVANADGTRVYIADRGNHVIRVFDTETHHLTTLAGLPGQAGFAEGIADEARFTSPEGLWVDSAEEYLFITDWGNDAIRRLNLATQAVTTVAGMPLGDEDIAEDGPINEATFDRPHAIVGVEDDDELQLFVSDAGSTLIRVIHLGGDEEMVTTLAGGGAFDEDNPESINATGADAVFGNPTGLAISQNGTSLYVADSGFQLIRHVDVDTAEVTTVVGDIGVNDSFDGVGDDATFSNPAHIALTGDDNVLLVSDRTNYAIRHVDLENREVSTLIGSLGTSGGSGFLFQPLDEARLYFTAGLTTVGDDVIFTADQALLRVSSILSEEEL